MLKSKSSTAFSFSYISLLSPSLSCGKTINKVTTVGSLGLSLSLFLVQAPRMEIFSHLNSEKSCSSKRGRLLNVCLLESVPWLSASKGLCRNAGCLGSWGGGTLIRGGIPAWGPLFSFSSACVKSAL